ncbi:Adipose-regulatory protein, Seipin, partial [Corchorus capsularis]
MMEEDPNYNVIPKPADWFTTLISLQADLLYNCFVTFSSPFLAVLSLASESYHRASETTASVETAVQKVPSNITHGSAMLLKRLGLGLLGAAQVCMVLVLVMGLAALVGIGLVQLWLEEPVVVREKLFFDYTEVNPNAVFGLTLSATGTGTGTGGGFDAKVSYRKRQINYVPVGHTFHLHLLLLMPESDFNRHIGVFQLTAELLSTTGNVIAKSSQPVMLRFRSLPVRLARTFLMGIPLLLGISSETQKLKVEILRYKEGHPRSGSVRVTLVPRAGTSSLPQLYEAEIIMNSQLPWTKQLVHNWKWTLYVWTSLYVYIIFLVLLISCFRPLFFPVTTTA